VDECTVVASSYASSHFLANTHMFILFNARQLPPLLACHLVAMATIQPFLHAMQATHSKFQAVTNYGNHGNHGKTSACNTTPSCTQCGGRALLSTCAVCMRCCNALFASKGEARTTKGESMHQLCRITSASLGVLSPADPSGPSLSTLATAIPADPHAGTPSNQQQGGRGGCRVHLFDQYC
jgi:hypothetical protein